MKDIDALWSEFYTVSKLAGKSKSEQTYVRLIWLSAIGGFINMQNRIAPTLTGPIDARLRLQQWADSINAAMTEINRDGKTVIHN